MVPHPPMLIPEIGRGHEKQVQKTIDAYEQAALEIADLKPETIIITSPHSVMYADYFHVSPGTSATGSFAEFGAGQVRFQEAYDQELTAQICAISAEQDFPCGYAGERNKALDHGTMVPLWFIRRHYEGGRIIRIGLSGQPLTMHYQMGQIIQKAVGMLDRKAVLVASGDLSHRLQDYGPYGFAPEGPEYDERIMDVCGRGSFGELFDFDESFCEKAAECGHRSFVIMAGALDGMAVEASRLSHEDITGVGYGICIFHPTVPDENRHFLSSRLKKQNRQMRKQRDREDPYVRLARQSLENYVRHHKYVKVPSGLPDEMLSKRAGTFVSLHAHGRLRGCIGTILPTTDCVAQEIINNAVSAAVRDPRFHPVQPEELAGLEIHVDVLGEPEDISSEAELDVRKYGVIVSSGGRRGLLLPDLDGVDTVSQQVSIAMQKAGIQKGEKIKLQRFEVIRHE